jgi:DNA-binding LytR/AlgR family response regulator
VKSKNNQLVFKNEELAELNLNLSNKIKAKKEKNPEIVISSINIKVSDKIHTIRVDEIRYIKAEDDGVRIFTELKSLWTDLSLKSIHSILPNDKLIRIYRSTIVNISFIDWVNHITLSMKDGTELKIGRSYKDNLKKIINSE